jgi:AcrR family transcriptional regulator
MARSAIQTNDLILDAAYGLFWRQGFVRVSMDQIAERANLTKRTIYQHFRSKDDLIAATLAHASALALQICAVTRPVGSLGSTRWQSRPGILVASRWQRFRRRANGPAKSSCLRRVR